MNSTGGSGRSIISGTATGPSSGIADSRRNRGYSNFTPSPLNGSTNMLHKQGQVFHRITQQATSTQSGIAASRVNSSRVRPEQVTFTNRRAPPKSRVSEGNCESAHVSNQALTDSPEPSYAVRRRPGQSIYKAPGQQQQQQNARLVHYWLSLCIYCKLRMLYNVVLILIRSFLHKHTCTDFQRVPRK